ncbi:hypothetical protein WMY93_033821 [Mugilogobius chulae]|uniref:Uncharacterized protein n=1 Tax=Mugilogobius chulae TaxID=88201 RepID=A0AAW0MJL0_9GOBI
MSGRWVSTGSPAGRIRRTSTRGRLEVVPRVADANGYFQRLLHGKARGGTRDTPPWRRHPGKRAQGPRAGRRIEVSLRDAGLDLFLTWLGSGRDTDVFWITHGRILDHKSETQRESEFTFDAGTDFQHEPLRGALFLNHIPS